jgi:hypothetical protein
LNRLLSILPASITVPPGVTLGRKAIPGNDPNHQWQHAGPNDQRGPCPGSNLLANYGYIPRNGVATLTQLIFGQMEGLGMSLDMSAILAVLGVGLCGDIRTQKVSIGGSDCKTDPTPSLCQLLHLPTACGLTKCHNSFESDMSIPFDDPYFHNGNPLVFNSTRWSIQKNIIDNQNNGLWDNNGITKIRDWQFAECVQNNPFCTRLSAILFDFGNNLIPTVMVPSGEDGKNVAAEYRYVAPFFGVSFDSTTNKYVWDKGGEKLAPINSTDPNWYRRAIPLSAPELTLLGLKTFLGGQPCPHLPGKNQGKTNSWLTEPSWQPPPNLTLDSNNAWVCWLFRLATDFLPCDSGNFLNTLLLNVLDILNWITDGIFDIYNPFCVAALM